MRIERSRDSRPCLTNRSALRTEDPNAPRGGLPSPSMMLVVCSPTRSGPTRTSAGRTEPRRSGFVRRAVHQPVRLPPRRVDEHRHDDRRNPPRQDAIEQMQPFGVAVADEPGPLVRAASCFSEARLPPTPPLHAHDRQRGCVRCGRVIHVRVCGRIVGVGDAKGGHDRRHGREHLECRSRYRSQSRVPVRACRNSTHAPRRGGPNRQLFGLDRREWSSEVYGIRSLLRREARCHRPHRGARPGVVR